MECAPYRAYGSQRRAYCKFSPFTCVEVLGQSEAVTGFIANISVLAVSLALILTVHPQDVLFLSEVSLEVKHLLYFALDVGSEKQQASTFCCCFSDFLNLYSDC